MQEARMVNSSRIMFKPGPENLHIVAELKAVKLSIDANQPSEEEGGA